MSKQDVFPNTERTAWSRMLEGGDETLADLRRELMTVYAKPLRVYYLKSSYRDLGDADDMVQGFFAAKFDRDSFMRGWALSGKRLRYWMIAGFKNYLREVIRDRKKHRYEPEPEDMAGPDAPDGSFHREAALEIVRAAIREASEASERDGWRDSWNIFVQHVLEGRGYAEFSREMGMTVGAITGRARTARKHFRRIMREHVSWPGATEEDIEHEIEQLMEVLSS